MEANHWIKVQDVSKSYFRGANESRVLDHLGLSVAQGEFVALMGPSGSGKTTLLNLVGGLDEADSGRVCVGEHEIHAMSKSERAAWRARYLGYVFQFYNLMPGLSVAQNIEIPLLLTHLSKAERAKQIEAAISLVGLDGRGDDPPKHLSGGQQQRVGIARAIAADPELLLCDEPTGDLDRETGDEILDLLDTLKRALGKTIIMVTHDPIAGARAARILHLNKGALTEGRVP